MGAFHHPYFRRDQPDLCVKMVCQKSRDRQQCPQKQRRLPPKKRRIPEAASPPVTYCTSSQVLSSTVTGTDTATTSYRPVQAAAPVSADDRSVGNSSTASQASNFTNSITVTSNNKYMASVKMTSSMVPPAATTVPVATVTTKTTTTTSSTKSPGGSGIMPYISNDSQFVASILRQRESLEVYRAAKAMLYDAYMKAVNEQQAP